MSRRHRQTVSRLSAEEQRRQQKRKQSQRRVFADEVPVGYIAIEYQVGEAALQAVPADVVIEDRENSQEKNGVQHGKKKKRPLSDPVYRPGYLLVIHQAQIKGYSISL